MSVTPIEALIEAHVNLRRRSDMECGGTTPPFKARHDSPSVKYCDTEDGRVLRAVVPARQRRRRAAALHVGADASEICLGLNTFPSRAIYCSVPYMSSKFRLIRTVKKSFALSNRDCTTTLKSPLTEYTPLPAPAPPAPSAETPTYRPRSRKGSADETCSLSAD